MFKVYLSTKASYCSGRTFRNNALNRVSDICSATSLSLVIILYSFEIIVQAFCIIGLQSRQLLHYVNNTGFLCTFSFRSLTFLMLGFGGIFLRKLQTLLPTDTLLVLSQKVFLAIRVQNLTVFRCLHDGVWTMSVSASSSKATLTYATLQSQQLSLFTCRISATDSLDRW